MNEDISNITKHRKITTMWETSLLENVCFWFLCFLCFGFEFYGTYGPGWLEVYANLLHNSVEKIL